jgi:acetyl-CoA carboxylase biotin carboxyl carrier protein
MDINYIKKLFKLFEESKVSEFELEEKDFKLKLSKPIEYPHVVSQVAPLTATFQPHHIHANEAVVEEKQSKESEEKSVKYHEIRSPIVGTFYRAPAPDSDPYVKIGDTVQVGSVLCIIEAMKLMNEIESDLAGKVIRILVENGKPVEYNQPLFLIEP